MNLTNKLLGFLITSALFVCLFYQASVGLNYVLFSFVLILINQYFIKPVDIKSFGIIDFLLFVAGVSVALVPSFNSYCSFFIIISIWSLKKRYPNVLYFEALITSTINTVSLFIGGILYLKNKNKTNKSFKFFSSLKKIFILFAAIIVALFFLFLYRVSNPIFSDFMDKINFSFINFEFVFFIILSLIVSFMLFAQYDWIGLLVDFEEQRKLQSEKETKTTSSNIHFFIRVLFGILNVFLLIMTIGDIPYVLFHKDLPSHINLSDFVHSAVNSLVFSIVMASSIVVIVFWGKIEKTDAYKKSMFFINAWLVQMAVVLLITVYRNSLYINAHGLTHLRIGVYVWLLLSLGGLIVLYRKLKHQISLWIAVNNYFIYLVSVLLLMSFVNWDIIITKYNLGMDNKKEIDFEYLIENLGDANLYILNELPQDEIPVNSYLSLQEKIEKYKRQNYYYNSRDWRSWNYQDYQLSNHLK